ncbi:MAG TPA: hypothetical protein VFM05_13610, partial [Candidatus Saccharimonadales bacterium]|nr:hypothetical protein [Candidatus Saccharimonadales bacterium]
LRDGLSSWRATGAEIARPQFLLLLAEAYGEAGEIENGLTALTEAYVLMDRNGDRWGEAELSRLKGDLLLQLDGGTRKTKGKKQNLGPKNILALHQNVRAEIEIEAEACFLQALDVARRQQAKSLELRATISLGRLWQRQGKEKKAYQLLSEIYGRFQEGLDTPDLQITRSFLVALRDGTASEKIPHQER